MGTTQGNDPRNFTEVRSRLEQIVTDVRSRDLSLEKSLDLYEEAIRLGNLCSDLVDKTDFSAEEVAALGSDEPADAGTVSRGDDVADRVDIDASGTLDDQEEGRGDMERDD